MREVLGTASCELVPESSGGQALAAIGRIEPAEDSKQMRHSIDKCMQVGGTT